MFRTLFTPLKVGNVTLKNRITQAPLYVGYANPDGTVSRETVEHYAKRARGGAALIVVEATSISPNSDGMPNLLRAYDDRYIPGLSSLARAIKENGAVACLQLFHAGRYARIERPLSASAVPFQPAPNVEITPKEMSQEDIEHAIKEFAAAAERVKRAGLDMVEIHGATGYLIVQFLSPLMNKRTDEYGGSPDNRMRFCLDVVKAVKGAVGVDFPVGMRFLAEDFLPGGFGLEEGKILAKKLEDQGIAYLSITGGVCESWFIPEIQEKLKQKGGLAYLAQSIKDSVRVPVFAGNRISTPHIAEEIISSGKADAVALGRPLLRDPEYPDKAARGREEDIDECISCFGCMELVMKGKKVVCVQREKKKTDSFRTLENGQTDPGKGFSNSF